MTIAIRNAKILILAGLMIILSNSLLAQPPVLLLPLNNSECVNNVGIVLDWNSVPTVVNYFVEVSLNSDMSSPIKSFPTTETQYTVDVPSLGTKYYWQAATVVGMTITRSAIWNFTTIKANPTITLPTDNNTCVQKTATFKWNTIVGSTYNLQISTASDFSSFVVNQSGISADSAVVALPAYGTQYYWRTRMMYNTCTTDYSTVRTFTTLQAPPTHNTPANNTFYVHKAGIRLTWTAPATPSTYTVQVASDSLFNSIYYEGIVSATTDTVSNLIGNTSYYWRIRADYSGCMTQWSGFRKFRTEYDPVVNLIPQQDSMCVPINARLRWDPMTNVLGYRIQISTDQDFAQIIFDSSNIAQNYVDYTFPEGQRLYFWHVKAKDGLNEGDYSNTTWFTSETKFGNRLLPDNGTENLAVSVKFKWEKPAQLSYERIQIAEDSLFAKIIFDVRNMDKDSLTLKMPNYFKKYYWRMNSLIFMCTSTWTGAWSFSTVLLPPVLNYPDNNADKISTSLTLDWKAVEGAQTYEFLLATDYTFKNIVIGKTGLPGIAVGLKDLATSSTFYWKVRAINSEGISAWSQIFTFKTAAKSLNLPDLISPGNGAENQPVNKVTLLWNKVFDANKYHLTISNVRDFKSTLININDYTDTSYVFTGLNYGITYYWKVQAIKDINDTSYSSWSQAFAFTTVVQIPTEAPSLTKPADKMDASPIDIAFEWDPVARAETYELQLGTDEQLTKLELNDTLVITNTRYLSGLKNITTYFWRVRAKNYSGKGPWSNTKTFTTIINSVDDLMIEKYGAFITPNPTSDDAMIHFNLNDYSNVRISLFASDGSMIRDLSNSAYNSGLQQINLDTKLLPSGYYFVKLRINNESMVLKLIIKK
jgi:hypothetical protein